MGDDSAILDLIETYRATHLVVVAEPQILGMMWEAMTDKLFKTINV